MTDISLDTLIAKTDAVAAAIANGDWESATELEIERRRLLQEFLDRERRAHGELEHLREALGELQSRGYRLVGEVHHHRSRVIREACTLKRGREAVREYSSSR